MKNIFFAIFLTILLFLPTIVLSQEDYNLSLISSLYDGWYDISGLAIHNDNEIYVVANHYWLYVFTIQNPDNPELLNRTQFDHRVSSIEIIDDHLFTTSPTNGLSIYNIVSTEEIQLIGNLQDFGFSIKTITDEQYLYAFGGTDDIRIVDIHNIENPQLVSGQQIPGGVTRAIKDGNFLYIINSYHSLYVYSIQDPSNIQYIESYPFPSVPVDIEIDGNRLYVSTSGGGLFIYDKTQPESIELLSQYSDYPSISSLEVSSDTLYVTNYNSYLDVQILDVSDPNNFIELSNLDYLVNLDKIKKIGNLLIIYDDSMMYTINIAQDNSMRFTYTYGQSFIRDIAKYDNLMLVPDFYNGIRMVDITHPEEPVDLFGIPIYGIKRIDNYENIIACASTSDLYLLEVLQENRYNIVSSLNFDESPFIIEMDSSYIYVLTSEFDFKIIDYGTSNTLDIVYEEDDRFGAYTILSDTLYTIGNITNSTDFYLKTYDISDPNEGMSLLTSSLLPHSSSGLIYATDIYRDETNTILVAIQYGLLLFININDPQNPIIINSFESSYRNTNIFISENLLYVSNGNNNDGIKVFDISNQDDIIENGFYNTPDYPSSIIAWDNYCAVADLTHFLMLEYEGSSKINNGFMPLIPSSFKINSVYPNPFNPSTNIAIDIPSDGMLEVAVFNILGQKVATLLNGPAVTGRHNIAFDGSTLSSGTYIIKATFNNREVSTQRIQLMK